MFYDANGQVNDRIMCIEEIAIKENNYILINAFVSQVPLNRLTLYTI